MQAGFFPRKARSASSGVAGWDPIVLRFLWRVFGLSDVSKLWLGAVSGSALGSAVSVRGFVLQSVRPSNRHAVKNLGSPSAPQFDLMVLL